MITKEEIARSLRARRVVPLAIKDSHGPLGLEHLASEVARLTLESESSSAQRIRRPIALKTETWEKLNHLAQTATEPDGDQLSASDVASALLERLLAETAAN